MNISTNPWIWIAVFFTFSIYSFLYKDNPFYRFAEHVAIGVSLGYSMVIWWNLSVMQRAVRPMLVNNRWDYIFPAILGVLILFRLFPKTQFLSRYSLAFLIGSASGVAIPVAVKGTILKQIQATLMPINLTTWAGFSNFILMVGVISGLVYFFFSLEHKGFIGGTANVGIWFLMIGFGATFGYTVMARISLVIGRVTFILKQFLGLNIGMG